MTTQDSTTAAPSRFSSWPRSARARGRVLLVDDDGDAASLLAETLTRRGFVVATSRSAEQALVLLREGNPTEVVLTDLRLGGATGVDLAVSVEREHPGIPVVVITAFGSIRAAIDAIRRGAYDFLTKPYDPEMVAITLDRAVGHTRSIAELKRLRAVCMQTNDGLISRHPTMRRTLDTVERVAKSGVSVVVTGESGTGKELVARALHAQSDRAAAPFVPINCAALPEQLLESELFGHTRGAFTDASSSRRGLFLQADGGTLFFDEVAEMPLSMQAKLLRVIQEGRVRPVGGDEEQAVDVRIVAATHRDLETEVKAGRFREDLYFRINVIEVPLPPLRARGDDVLLLAHEFLSRACARTGVPIPIITPEIARMLLAYDWPGNVRELQNVMEAALAFNQASELQASALPARIRDASPPGITPGVPETGATASIVTLEEMERRHILMAMRLLGGNRKLVAETLALDRSTLYRKLQRFGMHDSKERSEG